MIKQQFEIGTKFIRKYSKNAKVKHIETVIDVYKTFNSKNELVHLTYITTYEFCGQLIKHTALNTTIALGVVL